MRIFVLILSLMFALPARADDSSAIQNIIRSQQEAISRDDGDTAYSFAAPVIQDMFPDARIFMQMVHQGYAPLYRPRRFEFGEMRNDDGRLTQTVNIVDGEGVAWTALYTLQQQPDGSFRISGCSLIRTGQTA